VNDGRPAGKALAVDLGTRRIGLAVCDSTGTMAFPHTVLERSGDVVRDRAEIVRAVQETGATTLVVGLPLSLDGTDGPAALLARAEADELATALDDVSVVLFDERLTTVSAQAALGAAGRRGRAARDVVDSVAATVLLQAWLDAGRPRQ
jgi:putative holliday junction resolvase